MDHREIIARAYDREDAAQRGDPDPWSFSEGLDEFRDERLACAEQAIAALAEAGLVIVPVEPTWPMKVAGRNAITDDHDADAEIFDVSADDSGAAYRAMIAVA